MISRPSVSTPQAQQGVAALIMLILLVLGASYFLVSALNRSSSQTERDKITAAALAQAKAALIGRAATQSTPGQLPCPEDPLSIGTIQEGTALGSCSLPAVGRLPWRTLGLNDVRDGYGERLWYAISPGFRTAPINSDTPAQLTVDGIPNSAVAIIFSPGPAINDQTRPAPTATNPPAIAQYLEGENRNGDSIFTANGPTNTFNDRLLLISHDELFSVVQRRVVGEVRQALSDYFSAHAYYPRPAAFADTTCLGYSTLTAADCPSAASGIAGRIPANPTTDPWDSTSILRRFAAGNWFQSNRWREVIYYAVAPACTDGTTNCSIGSLTVNASPWAPLTNQKVIIIATGSALSGQDHGSDTNLLPKKLESNYLEDENLSPLDSTFTGKAAAPTVPFNDYLLNIP